MEPLLLKASVTSHGIPLTGHTYTHTHCSTILSSWAFCTCLSLFFDFTSFSLTNLSGSFPLIGLFSCFPLSPFPLPLNLCHLNSMHFSSVYRHTGKINTSALYSVYHISIVHKKEPSSISIPFCFILSHSPLKAFACSGEAKG